MAGPETLAERLQRYNAAVTDELRSAVATRHDLPSLYGMVHYHLGWVDESFVPTQASTGKGLRSAFCLLCCDVYGGDGSDAVAIAGAIELLHNFSLIHDDIEDGSHTRRHRRTVWSLWGAAQAINLGDALFALASLTFFRSPLVQRDPARFLEILRVANETIVDLAEGQYLDIGFETRQSVSTQEYLTMIERKSAVLIATRPGQALSPQAPLQKAACRDLCVSAGSWASPFKCAMMCWASGEMRPSRARATPATSYRARRRCQCCWRLNKQDQPSSPPCTKSTAAPMRWTMRRCASCWPSWMQPAHAHGQSNNSPCIARLPTRPWPELV